MIKMVSRTIIRTYPAIITIRTRFLAMLAIPNKTVRMARSLIGSISSLEMAIEGRIAFNRRTIYSPVRCPKL